MSSRRASACPLDRVDILMSYAIPMMVDMQLNIQRTIVLCTPTCLRIYKMYVYIKDNNGTSIYISQRPVVD